MPAQLRASKAQKEGQTLLALRALRNNRIPTIAQAACTYNVARRTLSDRLHGRVARVDTRANNHKLTLIEEQVLIEWILNLDERGYPLRIQDLREAATVLLQQRDATGTIGINWPTNFVKRRPEIKAKFNRKYDYARALSEDSDKIQAWFRLVQNTREKYGILDEDIYNFDETGYMLGIATTTKVITAVDRAKPKQIQPGNREWVTAVECINSSGWCLPPMVIFKGKVHLSAWFENAEIPPEWRLAISSNGWTTNELGLVWLKEVFQAHTITKVVGKYRLLVLDGHNSHSTPKFDKFCKDHDIITLCMPPHSSHLLQPLDVGCFSVLKRVYGSMVAENIRLGIDYVDKAEMLSIHKAARLQALSPTNIRSGFRATGLVPFQPSTVLDTLEIRQQTPPHRSDQPALDGTIQTTPQADKTPRTLAEVDAHFKAIQGFIQRRSKSPPTPTGGALSLLVKGTQLAIHEAALLRAENAKLQAANAKQKQKRKGRSKYISKKVSLTIAEGQEQLRARETPVLAPVQPHVQAPARVPAERLPSCYKCYGFDHVASVCPAPQAS